jgi:TfoX/Sxy family transcriptional regulator of competence genes
MPKKTSASANSKGTSADQQIDPRIDPRFAPVAAAFSRHRDVTAGMMMSSYGLKVNGKIFVMYGRDKFVAKLPKARVDALVDAGTGERFDPGHGRVMKEWIAIASHPERWIDLATEAYDFVKQGAVAEAKAAKTSRRS